MCHKVPKFAEEKFKINLLDGSSKDTLLSKANNNDANDFCGYLKLNALLLSFATYNTLNNREKWQNLNQEKISVGRKRIFKKISLLFFGVNVNVLNRTSLKALWNMLQPLKHWRRVVLMIRNHFLISYGESQRSKWKQVGIYSG